MATPNNPFEQIILPAEAPSAWPPAPIYWLILFIAIISIGLLIWLVKRRKNNKKIVKKALYSLQQLQKNEADFVALNQLFKGLCLQYYPRPKVASLAGKEWFIFINQHNAQKQSLLFKDQDTFCQRLYKQSSICTQQDFEMAKQWIKDFPEQVIALQKSMQVGKDNV